MPTQPTRRTKIARTTKAARPANGKAAPTRGPGPARTSRGNQARPGATRAPTSARTQAQGTRTGRTAMRRTPANAIAIDTLAGKTVRWTFEDGPTAGQEFEHRFGTDGDVAWSMPGAATDELESTPSGDASAAYEEARIGSANLVAFSYLAPSGWTLTGLLDPATSQITAFASNESTLVQQRGTFHVMGGSSTRKHGSTPRPATARHAGDRTNRSHERRATTRQALRAPVR